MSYPRKTLIEELRKYARLIREGRFDADDKTTAEVIGGAAAMLLDDLRAKKKHGLVAWSSNNRCTFFQTDPAKLDALEAAKTPLSIG